MASEETAAADIVQGEGELVEAEIDGRAALAVERRSGRTRNARSALTIRRLAHMTVYMVFYLLYYITDFFHIKR